MTTTKQLSPEQVWGQVCSQLQKKLSPAVYNTWIVANPITDVKYSADVIEVVITSPTAFHATNLQKNLHKQISQAIGEAGLREFEIKYTVGSPLKNDSLQKKSTEGNGGTKQTMGQKTAQEARQASKDLKHSSKDVAEQGLGGQVGREADRGTDKGSFLQLRPKRAQKQTGSPRVEDLFSEETMRSAQKDRVIAIARRIGLRSDYTFENFAVSTTNEMAHAAATAVSNSPGSAYNPLFLYGGVGVGKTHLMHAIGNSVLEKNPDTKMVYCTGEEFTNEIVLAIRNKQAAQFKQKYRNIDVFLVDDVQFLAGKNTVQEEFFHTFNALTKQASQVVLTSDRPPHEINLIEDRLRSRFEAGLMIDIGQPSFELRTAILLVKTKAINLHVPIEMAKTIAARVESARKIEGIITSIRSEIEFKGREISQDLIDEVLSKEIEKKRPQIKAKPNEIIKTVANHYRVKQSAVRGGQRTKTLVTARHIAMYLLKKELSLPLVEIGQWFSGRDHSSVLHAVRKVEKLLSSDNDVQQDISALRMNLAAG